MMKTKSITMLLITVIMVVAAQFNTICAQSTKNSRLPSTI